MASSGERGCLLSLPREMIIHILGFLGPVDLMAIERTSRELSRLARVPNVLRTTKFLPNYSADSLQVYLEESRAVQISELDLNGFLAANTITLERCVQSCVNLTTLRCANTRLLPTAMIRLLRDRLRYLQFLEWSILGNAEYQKDVDSFCWEPPNDGRPPVIPETLRGMYVEVSSSRRNNLFLCSFLKRCSGLRNLHFHEIRYWREVATAAYSVLQSYHDGTAGKFETFTFTADAADVACEPERTTPDDEWSLLHTPESLLGVLKASLNMSPSVVVRQNLMPSANCVVLDSCTAHLVPSDFSNLFILIKYDAFAALEAASHYQWHLNTRALTLKVCPPETMARKYSASATDATSFYRFFAGCQKLTELNLAAFHFEVNFDCCSVMVDAGLIFLRALTLPSCALRCPGRLEQLARASFRLEELDVRAAHTARPVSCVFCSDSSTCTEEVFGALRLICPLRRLTLCDLPHVRGLQFLTGCLIRELRLRNLGLGGFATEETIAALKE
ncbi:hypothetical protein V5799_031593, partial [Amblyomma americanum]